jgi:hypothetical protein
MNPLQLRSRHAVRVDDFVAAGEEDRIGDEAGLAREPRPAGAVGVSVMPLA